MTDHTRHNESESSSVLQILNRSLRERIKELDCLYEVVRVLVDHETSIAEALKRIAAAIPHGFSDPNRTQVRITYDSYECTEGAVGTVSESIREPMFDGEETKGSIQVGIVGNHRERESSFLPEEKTLLAGVSDVAAAVIRRITTQHSLVETCQELKDKNIALREVLFQIESEKQRFHDSVWQLLAIRVFPLIQENPKLEPEEKQNLINDLEHELKLMLSVHGASPTNRLDTLSPREFQACGYIKAGMSNKEIGELMRVSPATVEKHRHSIRRKLGLTNTKTNLSVYLRNL